MNTVVFFLYLLGTSIKASISKRGAFLIESGLMVANNLIFLSIWWIFFQQFKEIAGWKIQDMVALMAIGTGSYGFMQICFGGVKNLSRIILNGDLDPYMTKPKNLLLHILGSKSFVKGWGHLFTAIIFIILGKIYTLQTVILVFVGMLCGCFVFTAINIIAHSLPFWMGSVESLSKKYCDALFLFALYPTNIYSGLLQLVMFTLIPAGVITYLPVELIRRFTWSEFFILVLSSVAFFGLAFLVFYSGLKKYESGNQIGTRL